MISRRDVLAGLGAIPAIGGATAALAATDAAQKPELTSERVVRLAKALSLALDDLNREAWPWAPEVDEGTVGVWIASVWPSKINPHVCLEQKDVPAALARFAAVRS